LDAYIVLHWKFLYWKVQNITQQNPFTLGGNYHTYISKLMCMVEEELGYTILLPHTMVSWDNKYILILILIKFIFN
jgi:hypothetical protein